MYNIKKNNIKFDTNPNNDIEGILMLIGDKNVNLGIPCNLELFKIIGLANVNFSKSQISDIKNLIKEEYNKKQLEIITKTKEVEKQWKKKEKVFIKLFSIIFNNGILAISQYSIYPSICDIPIRDFKNKRISFPYKTSIEEIIFVIAHEFLHVIFYDYLYTKHKKLRDKIESKEVWDFSEALNVVIQNQKEWLNIFGIKPAPYSQHQELYNRMEKIWDKEKNLDFLIKEILM